MDIQIHQHFSLQRCGTSFSAARPVFAPTLGYDINHCTTSHIPWNWKSQCTRKMTASQSWTVHPKTHRVCPIHTRNIGPIGWISRTIPSPWIEPLPKGRHNVCHPANQFKSWVSDESSFRKRELKNSQNEINLYAKDPNSLDYLYRLGWVQRPCNG